MKHSPHLAAALLAALYAGPVLAAPATPTFSETAAAQEARAAREAIVARQKELFEEKNIATDIPAKGPATVIDLPVDDSDSPGAVKK